MNDHIATVSEVSLTVSEVSLTVSEVSLKAVSLYSPGERPYSDSE